MNTSTLEKTCRLPDWVAGKLAGQVACMNVREAIDAMAVRLVFSTSYQGQVCRRAACLMVLGGHDISTAFAMATEQNSMPLTWWRPLPNPALVALVAREVEALA